MKAATVDRIPIRSYAESNRELLEAYCRYLVARGQAAPTIRSYRDSISRLVESLGSESVIGVERSEVRVLLAELYGKGLAENSIRLHTAALRNFFKYLRLAGLTKHDPTLMLAHRKLPGRLPIVLTIQQVEALISAGRDPFDRAVVEVLYSTGVRVSELVNLKIENIDFAEHVCLVKDGKGGKDRYVLFGSYAVKAMQEYLAWRPHETPYLFEAPARRGSIHLVGGSWFGRFYSDCVQRDISIGSKLTLPAKEDARRKFDRLLANIPGYKPLPARPYRSEAIGGVLNRLAHRAGIKHVHPHALRRTMATHMLAGGASIRAVQELLGHERIGTTMLYTHLDAIDLKKVHERCHPHEQGAPDAEKES